MQDVLAVFPALVEHRRRQSFLPVFPCSVRKLPPGAWVYFSKLYRMQLIIELEGKNLFFSVSFLFPSTLVSCPEPLKSLITFLFGFSDSHDDFNKTINTHRREAGPGLEVDRLTAFQSFSFFLQENGIRVR